MVFSNLFVQMTESMSHEELVSLSQIVLLLVTITILIAITYFKPQWNIQNREKKIYNNKSNFEEDFKIVYYEKKYERPKPIIYMPVKDDYDKMINDYQLRQAGVAIESKRKYEPKELENQILNLLTLGNNSLRDDIIRLLTRLSTVEDTSDFLDDNPQVLKYIFTC
jgi:uncharacterized protein YeeX (DUF496 family)